MATKKQNLDTLLVYIREHDPEFWPLEAVLTQVCISGLGGHQPLDGTNSTSCVVCGKPLNQAAGRILLLLDSAIVAAQEWVLAHPWADVRYESGTGMGCDVAWADSKPDSEMQGEGTDIFEAILDAMKEE